MSDETFDAGWLALREPADHRARSRSLVHDLRQEGRRRGWRQLLDLGTGTGSNLRYVTARVPWARRWLLLDHDAALLARAATPMDGVEIETRLGSLDDDGLAAVDDVDVVTASALLDLVSESWLRRLRDRCVETGAAAYFALSYDGTVRWTGGSSDEALDATVLDAVNRHQRGDKGLGPALGPDAGPTLADLFREAGYRVRTDASIWTLAGARDGALVGALVDGWVSAAAQVLPDESARLRAWGREKIEAVLQDRIRIEVGHVDVLAVPGEPTGAASAAP